MTPEGEDALVRVLQDVDVRVGMANRHLIAAGSTITLPLCTTTLAFIVEGDLTGDTARGRRCTLDAAGDVAAPAIAAMTMSEGDAFLSLGRHEVTLTSASGAILMVAELELQGSELQFAALPALIFVTGFDRAEPAAAALAGVLGAAAKDESAERATDPLICRTMMRTILMSLIRAWAHSASACERWPQKAADPFLDRVVRCIIADPGRAWTVDELAGVSAMSRTVFAERFRETYGTSPANYVTTVRMRAARELLAGGRTVSTVSRELGYESDEGFRRAFRKHVGVAPSVWKSGTLAAVG